MWKVLYNYSQTSKYVELEELKNKIKNFDEKAGFDKTEFSKLMEMFEEEISILKYNPAEKSVVNHQLTDLLILIMQVAHRYDTNFEEELSKWFEKSKKYIKWRFPGTIVYKFFLIVILQNFFLLFYCGIALYVWILVCYCYVSFKFYIASYSAFFSFPF